MRLAEERIWRTADGRYVADGHPDAAILHAAAGDEIDEDLDFGSDAAPPADGDELDLSGTVEEVCAWIGDDPERALVALETENESAKPRKGVTDHAEAVIDAAPPADGVD